MFSSMLLSSCSFQQTAKEEKQFVGNADGAVDLVSGPISLKDTKKYFSEAFKVPTYLPYDVMSGVKGEVRTIGKKNAVLTIKYKQQEKRRKDYIELTVANFSYSFPYIVEQNRFQEQMKLNNGATAYFKNRDEFEQGEEFATLIWKEKGLEYQLLYRNVELRNEEIVKQNLAYIANNMEEKN
ncbi:DNA polymerase III subunit delta [Bacillus arachidis]|uniref:DNA polymerase III subunit delta n=1 Tax=Bacillus arachidis TaxID=2819290 RepID=UPI00255C596A|nr:DNA polymerase III subunit delta [Bacillus arachidis]WIY63676.1 DNA polymerase III subunit delta [Bacillus arachidis]